MREIQIEKNESGQRLDKFLKKYLREATGGFIYKMLRKKNIKLNGGRAEGKELLQPGDVVTLYLSEETLEKFRGIHQKGIHYPVTKLDIIYEDDNIILVNKPAGMLSQKAKPEDVSLVEYLLGYLQSEGKWHPGDTFTPGICNRLDRNTSGLVIAGKSLLGTQMMSELLKKRALDKYYITIVEGVMTQSSLVKGYLSKDTAVNVSHIFGEPGEGRVYIETGYEPICHSDCYTLLRVKLITGKTHQIRSHLASIGHPVINDRKYGGRNFKDLKHFLLHAETLHFPKLPEPLEELSGQTFAASVPEQFEEVKKYLFRYVK